jgi:hypothetical protein
MAKQITWSYHTEYGNGYINPTYTWKNLQAILNFVGEYWDNNYVQVAAGKGRVQFIQSRTQISTPGAWMWTRSGFKTYISPVVNYGKNQYLCAKTTMHEMFHWVNMGHLGGTVPLMTPNGGTCHNITQQDAPYMSPYTWRSNRRPWLEPELILQRFPNSALATVEEHEDYRPQHNDIFSLLRAEFSSQELTKIESPYQCCQHKVTTWYERLKSRFITQEIP